MAGLVHRGEHRTAESRARPTTSVFYPSERATKPLCEKGRQAADQLVNIASAMIGDGKTTLFDVWCIADARIPTATDSDSVTAGASLPAPASSE